MRAHANHSARRAHRTLRYPLRRARSARSPSRARSRCARGTSPRRARCLSLSRALCPSCSRARVRGAHQWRAHEAREESDRARRVRPAREASRARFPLIFRMVARVLIQPAGILVHSHFGAFEPPRQSTPHSLNCWERVPRASRRATASPSRQDDWRPLRCDSVPSVAYIASIPFLLRFTACVLRCEAPRLTASVALFLRALRYRAYLRARPSTARVRARSCLVRERLPFC